MEKAVPQIGDPSSAATSDADAVPRTPSALPDIVQLITLHHACVYRYALRLTGVEADAEDLAQQAFLLAHQRLAQLRDADRAAGWLMAIVRNCFLKSKRRATAPIEPLLQEPIAADEQELPDWIDPEHLQNALARLPDDARTILVMFFFEECSYREIAEVLEIPIGTVMSRLSRAKTRLKSELVGEGEHAGPVAAPSLVKAELKLERALGGKGSR